MTNSSRRSKPDRSGLGIGGIPHRGCNISALNSTAKCLLVGWKTGGGGGDSAAIEEQKLSSRGV